MKKILHISLIVVFCTSIAVLTSCEDMLTVDSTRFATVDENSLSSCSDTVSTVLGILKCTQKIGERYILLGEMRADLLDVTPNTTAAIRQLSNFTADSTNAYTNPRDYYAIINNCNYFISRTAGADSPLKKENALVHTIRAWTYLQIAINWGKVHYYTKPLLTVDDTKKNFPTLDITELADSLIADLEPYKNAAYPDYGKIYDFISDQLFLPTKLVLGDLYLWRGSSTADYEKAATCYAEFINFYLSDSKGEDILKSQPQMQWTYDNYLLQNFETAAPSNNWSSRIGATQSNEMITAIQMSLVPSEGIVCGLPLNADFFKASNVINSLWDKQTYVLHHVAGTLVSNYSIPGDLRMQGNIMTNFVMSGSDESNTILYKLYNSKHILLYRLGLVYLRYAEAVNRAGYPSTAFAVLKYGLKPLTIADETKIPLNENAATVPFISIFNNNKFDNIIGIHARGCGDTEFDVNYKIGGIEGNLATKSDSIAWVEEAICDELALETSFEGNRFGDLVRIASRRNDLDFLAKRVAAKNGENGRIRKFLKTDKKNWFLPEFSNIN